MGISYIPQTITGFYDHYWQIKEVIAFLAEHGYTISDDDLDEFNENGWEDFADVMGVKFNVDCTNGCSGHGHYIGIEGNDPESLKIMQEAFPNCKPDVFQFVALW